MRKPPGGDDVFGDFGAGHGPERVGEGGGARGGKGGGDGGEAFDSFLFSDPVFSGAEDDDAEMIGFGDDVPMDDRLSIEDAFGASLVEVPDLSGAILAGVAERGVFLDGRGRRRLKRTRLAVCGCALLCAAAFTAVVRSYPELTVWAFRPSPLTDTARSAELFAGRTAAFASSTTRGVGFETPGPTVPTIMRLTGFDAGALPARVETVSASNVAAGHGGMGGGGDDIDAAPRVVGVVRLSVTSGGSTSAELALGLRTGVFGAEPAWASWHSGSAEVLVADVGAGAVNAGDGVVRSPVAVGGNGLRALADGLGADRITASRLRSVRLGLDRLGEIPLSLQQGLQQAVSGGGGVRPTMTGHGVVKSSPSSSSSVSSLSKVSVPSAVPVVGPSRTESMSARGWFNPDGAALPR